jgi:hypothetical protein
LLGVIGQTEDSTLVLSNRLSPPSLAAFSVRLYPVFGSLLLRFRSVLPLKSHGPPISSNVWLPTRASPHRARLYHVDKMRLPSLAAPNHPGPHQRASPDLEIVRSAPSQQDVAHRRVVALAPATQNLEPSEPSVHSLAIPSNWLVLLGLQRRQLRTPCMAMVASLPYLRNRNRKALRFDSTRRPLSMRSSYSASTI